ncbi:MAG: DNA gyrase/topoisomerase IV subunit A [Bacteroidales bacterium]|nr:DNA gyrase/topoisomerase IV subunit A [Bacteroidales bacterium]
MAEKDNIQELQDQNNKEYKVKYISGMFKNWFLDYASYVILERAVPHISDGLKPVQKRILHSMKRMDDGRYNKVANIIGHTMQFHPHGDASIGDALVQLGQKDLLIDMQGNWGNILTGDSAAAPRYIEARLSKFALDVVFNPKTTVWKQSYDGRNKEPVHLPVKFPLLLAQGVEGIAVGLASKIMPHNFNELIDASINHLKGKDFEILPDFQTAGLADFSDYNDGKRGGKVRVRARISKQDNKTLVISEIPFGKTTSSLIESIVYANDKGKIKIKKIEDNTSDKVEILIHLPPDVSSDKMIDALYAVTDCELSISPNTTVIIGEKPRFLGVSEILRFSTDNTLDLLKSELEIRMSELEESWHLSSLEKIFIENRIYNDIEDCETWDCIIETIDKGLKPFTKKLKREVTVEDITRLTEIKIKRISKYDAFKADRYLQSVIEEIKQIKYNLEHIVDFTIDYFKDIQKKHGKGKERKTEIRNFEEIKVRKVVVRNKKLYVNYKDGFAGMSLRQDEFVADCSDIDLVIVFRKDGTYFVKQVDERIYIGKDVIHIDVWKKDDDRTIYNTIHFDGKSGYCYMKRFNVKSIIRDKEYNLTKGKKGSKVLWFTANPNGEAETVKITHRPRKRLKNKVIEIDFSELAIKGKKSMGNIVTKYGVQKITLKEEGISTLGGREIWFDHEVFKLNPDGRGEYLGEFIADEKILVIYDSGEFQIKTYELSNQFNSGVVNIEKYNPEKIWTAVFYEGEQKFNYIKRFKFEGINGKNSFIGEHKESEFILISDKTAPEILVEFGGKHKKREDEIIDAEEFISEKSVKARGKRLTTYTVKKITEIIQEEDEDMQENEIKSEPPMKVISEEDTKYDKETVDKEVVSKETVSKETAKETVSKEIAKETAGKEIAKETVSKEIVKETISKETAKETVSKEPEFEVIKTDANGKQTKLDI